MTVRVEESDYFRREGQDVHTQASISLSQAILGGVIRVSGLYEDINLRIPAGTSSHTAMTLSDRGIKHMDSSNQFGDHVVHITIKMPTNLTEEQLELVREYALTERDTPGTVDGLERSSRFRRASTARSESDSERAERMVRERVAGAEARAAAGGAGAEAGGAGAEGRGAGAEGRGAGAEKAQSPVSQEASDLGDDNQSTLNKITEAIGQNVKVVKIRKMLGL